MNILVSESSDANWYSLLCFVVKISGTDVMAGVQIGVHSATGAWEVLYGEFVQYPESILPYKYYSQLDVSKNIP